MDTSMQIAGSNVTELYTWYRSSKDSFVLGLPFCGDLQLFLQLQGVRFPCEHSNTSHSIALSLCPDTCKTGVTPSAQGHSEGHARVYGKHIEPRAGLQQGPAGISSLFLGQLQV